MTDVNTSRIIQVVAPGDVNFALGTQSTDNDTTVVVQDAPLNTDSETICMSMPSFIVGLVFVLLVIVVSCLVAGFLFLRERAMYHKNAGIHLSFPHPAYVAENPELIKVAN